jgi:hypothetical protein
MFIGSKEIKVQMDKDEKNFSLEFDDGSTTVINKELLALIQTEEKGDGNITDNINNYFARKFLAELAYYDLGYYFTTNVGTAIEVLAHNLRERLISDTFGCTGGSDINLRLLTGVKELDKK